jgi:N-methylhydantoinase A/oxoprolinase/acetone carboxylase beta subunit
MEQALRTVSVERGVDPRGLALVAFGGAGPLHACRLADALGMPCVIVPARAGVLSAVGILGAPRQADAVVSRPDPLDHHHLVDDLEAVVAQATAALDAPAGAFELRAGLECRYLGQSHELPVRVAPPGGVGAPRPGAEPGAEAEADDADDGGAVADVAGVSAEGAVEKRPVGGVQSVLDDGWRDAFHAEHARRNGFARRDQPIEVVAVRATASVRSPAAIGGLPVVERRSAVGPAVIAEPDCTVWLPEGWRADPGAAGALVLTRC